MTSGQSTIQEVAELYSASGHTWQPKTFLAKILMTLVTVVFSSVIICCVFAPLLVSPSLTELWSSPLQKYTWQNTTLEKSKVADQRSSVLRLTLATAYDTNSDVTCGASVILERPLQNNLYVSS